MIGYDNFSCSVHCFLTSTVTHRRVNISTTAKIAQIYDTLASAQGFPGYASHWQEWQSNPPAGWVYANQPYVDKVLAYASLYRADFNKDQTSVDLILSQIKKKDYRLWRVNMRVLGYPWERLPC